MKIRNIWAILMIANSLNLGGCMGMMRFNGLLDKDSLYEGCSSNLDRDPEMYSNYYDGAHRDMVFIKMGGFQPDALTYMSLGLLDLPFSFIEDTVMIPYDFYYQNVTCKSAPKPKNLMDLAF